MKLKNSIFIFAALLCVVSGCNPAKNFSIAEAPAPVMNGTRSIHGKAAVSSTARSDLMIESARFVIRYRERELVTARLMLPIEVPAGAVSGVRYDLALENTSLSNLQTLYARVMSNPIQVTADVSGYIRYGSIRKKIEMERVPVIRIITTFAE